MLSVENVATPLTALAVIVPASVPLDGFVPMAIVTWFVAPLTRLPVESSTDTWTAGDIELPAATLPGWTVNASFAGGPTETMMLKAALIAGVSPAALAVSV